MLLLLFVTYCLCFVDRQIVLILAESIKADLQLSDTQLGLLTGVSFALFYTTLAVPIARLADRGNRVTIISVAFATWNVMTAICGLSSNYLQLFVARAMVGVGEAGCSPAAHSLLTDYFPQRTRARAFAPALSRSICSGCRWA